MSKLKYYRTLSFTPQPSRLRERFPSTGITGVTLSTLGFDLLSRLLAYDPSKRISAADALKHPWFEENPRPKPTALMPTFPAAAAAPRWQ